MSYEAPNSLYSWESRLIYTLSTKTTLSVDRPTKILTLSTKTPLFVDRPSEILTLSTKTPLFVDRECVKRGSR